MIEYARSARADLCEYARRVPQGWVAVHFEQPGVTRGIDHNINPKQVKAALYQGETSRARAEVCCVVRTHLALAKFAADAGDDRAQHGDELRSGWGFRVWGVWFRVWGFA